MTADEVIERRNLWRREGPDPFLPVPLVLAEHDWLAYVQAMTAAMPHEQNIVWPSEVDCHWAWPDGVTIVFAEPVKITHAISSVGGPEIGVRQVDPHEEHQQVAGMAIGPYGQIPAQAASGEPVTQEFFGRPLIWIGADPTDVVTGWWVPETFMDASLQHGVSESTRQAVALLTALGHRLTRLAEPATAGRGERRRVQRELPGLRVLQLATGASVRSESTGTVEWSHRWMVRGHWRLQPYGARGKLRRLKWIDLYVKGPEDKPLDVRSTIWRTGQGVPEE